MKPAHLKFTYDDYVLIPEDGESAYVAHLIGGAVTVVSLARPEDPPRRIFTRPERRPAQARRRIPSCLCPDAGPFTGSLTPFSTGCGAVASLGASYAALQ